MLTLSSRVNHSQRPASAAAPEPKPSALPSSLLFHPLTDPPVAQQHDTRGSPRVGGVWCTQTLLDGGARLLTRRHLALQAMQLKVDILLGDSGAVWNPPLRLFVNGQLNHAYLDGRSFAELAKPQSSTHSEPSLQPSFIDAKRECVMIDASRFFWPDTAKLTAEAIQSIVLMSEAPNFAMLLRRTDANGEGAVTLRSEAIALQYFARQILRHALHEPGVELSPMSEQLVQQLQPCVIAQAILGGSRSKIHQLYAVFMQVWAQRTLCDSAPPPLAEPLNATA